MKFMKNYFKSMLAFMFALVLMLSMTPATVYAAEGDVTYQVAGATVDPETYDPISAGTTGATLSVVKYVERGGMLVNEGTYEIKIENGKVVSNNVPGNPFKYLAASGSQQAMDAIQDIKNLTNVHADLGAAQQTLEPIIEMVNTIIGILATAILILVGLFTAIDILYLEVPAFHNSMDQKGMEKGQVNKSGGVKHKLISEDASQAYEEAQKDGKNPMIVYLKKRIVAYIAVAIVLYMLLSGNLSLIVEVVLKMLNGVFGWVEDYSKTM